MGKFFKDMYDGAVLLHNLWEYNSIFRFRVKRLHKYKVNKLKGITITPSIPTKPVITPKKEIIKELHSSGNRYKDVLYVKYISDSSTSRFTKGKIYEVIRNKMYKHLKDHYINFIADNGTDCWRHWRDSKGNPTSNQKDFIEVTKEEYDSQNTNKSFSGYNTEVLSSLGLVNSKNIETFGLISSNGASTQEGHLVNRENYIRKYEDSLKQQQIIAELNAVKPDYTEIKLRSQLAIDIYGF